MLCTIKRWFNRSPRDKQSLVSDTDGRESRFLRPADAPPLSKNTAPKRLIIFVHGVLGSVKTTWGAEGTSWPQFVINDKRFSDFDVYVVNYRTTLLHTAANIYEVACNE